MNMKRKSTKAYLADLAARGQYHFSSADAQKALGISTDAAKLALNRLSKQGLLASPARGFYVIVPPEYRSLGSLPADQFIPQLMKQRNRTYYAGLLSAAQYHGAAHHRPQEFQVFLATSHRPIICGAVRVAFFVRKRIAQVAVQSFNTPRGTILVSTPEATAFDLVGYQNSAGGLDQVATILAELAEMIDPKKLAMVAQTAPLPWAQRLGYLLETVDASSAASDLKDYVCASAKQFVPLVASAPHENASRNEGWKLAVNAKVEAEL